MPHTPTPKYPFTQQELYSIADTMYDNLENPTNLAAFQTKKPGKYTPAFIAQLRANKKAAFTMPDDDQRNSIHETFKVELIGLADTCCNLFQDLKGYIHDGFPKDQWNIKYDEAGMTVYESASHNNWENVVALNKKVNDFIEANPAPLTDGFMPATFPGDCTTASTAFDSKYAAFKTSRQTGTGTGAKITADNIVYADLQNLQNDGHIVFRKDAEALKQFMMSHVKNIVSPPGSASLGIDLIEQGSNLPVANAIIIIQSATGIAITLTSDASGKVDFHKINPDTYKVKIKPVGKPEINIVKQVDTGVNARLKVTIPA
ncbi:MAG: carboxypeptidase-like regulatory domain-containing protein [Bacteroidota bacterium]